MGKVAKVGIYQRTVFPLLPTRKLHSWKVSIFLECSRVAKLCFGTGFRPERASTRLSSKVSEKSWGLFHDALCMNVATAWKFHFSNDSPPGQCAGILSEQSGRRLLECGFANGRRCLRWICSTITSRCLANSIARTLACVIADVRRTPWYPAGSYQMGRKTAEFMISPGSNLECFCSYNTVRAT